MKCFICRREAAQGVMLGGGLWIGPHCARKRGILPARGTRARRAAMTKRVIVRIKPGASDGQITLEGFDAVEVVHE